MEIERTGENKNRVLEADLNGHLSNGSAKEEKEDERDEKTQQAMDKLKQDNQLYEALNILKAINIYKGTKI